MQIREEFCVKFTHFRNPWELDVLFDMMRYVDLCSPQTQVLRTQRPGSENFGHHGSENLWTNCFVIFKENQQAASSENLRPWFSELQGKGF